MASRSALADLISACGLSDRESDVDITGSDPVFRTRYRVGETAAAAASAAGLAAARLWELRTGRRQRVSVDVRAAAASLRCYRYFRLNGRPFQTSQEKTSGFYASRDGRWIYLHCNFPHIRDRALEVLGAEADRASVARAVSSREGEELEGAIFAAGGCAALMRAPTEWSNHPQARAVASMPLLEIIRIGDAPREQLPDGDRPLSGVRVLDATRVIAGPFAGRTLAEHGAEVLKISRKDLPDSGMFDIDTGNGKRSAFLDFRETGDREVVQRLIKQADVFCQSYRPGALADYGLSPEGLARLRPGIVYVTLSAWGHVGPFASRRGYDTIAQSANGMAYESTEEGAAPRFMPVSAMDYLSGYLMSLGAMTALARRSQEGGSWLVRASLAGAGHWLAQQGMLTPDEIRDVPDDLSQHEIEAFTSETSIWSGTLRHLGPVVELSETPPHWSSPPRPLGCDPPAFRSTESVI